MKKKFTLIALLSSLFVASCSPVNPSTPTDTSTPTSTTSTPGGMSVEEVEDYDAWCDTWSQRGHLYIHYLRPDATSYAEYEQYCLWMWQKAPKDEDGVVFAASSTTVQNRFNVHQNNKSWMQDIGGSGKRVDQAGVCVDIDLNIEYPRADKNKQTTYGNTSFIDATRVGFLVPRQDSMGGGSNFVSDRAADTYIDEFDTHFRANGSMHIFLVSGDLANFKFSYDENYEVNPTIKDTTGQYVSKSDVVDANNINKWGVTKTSQKFLDNGKVGYQIFVPSFADSNGDGFGDIKGITNKLLYLKELNVDTLWLTPIQKSDSYHGYDITDYYVIDPKFGTLNDYRELLFEAHKLGMKVLMDLVINHTSLNNVWFKRSERAEVGIDSKGNSFNFRDMYHWKFEGEIVKVNTKNGYKDVALGTETQELIDDYGFPWYRYGTSKYYYYGKFGKGMAELNFDCQSTRDFVVDMANYWLGFGVDGFRLDAVKHIYMVDESKYTNFSTRDGNRCVEDLATISYYDTEKEKKVDVTRDYSSDTTKNVNWWTEFSFKIKNIYPNAYLVGENFDGWDKRIAPYYRAMDSQFDFSMYFHNYQYIYGKSQSGYGGSVYNVSQENDGAFNGKPYMFSTTSDLVDGNNKFYGGGRTNPINAPFTSNHDTPRQMNTMAGSSTQGPVSVENNYQEIINRVKVDSAIKILSPGLTYIYYGDEIGMTSNFVIQNPDHDNQKDRFFRQPFKWSNNLTDEGICNNVSVSGDRIAWDTYNQNILKTPDEQRDDPNSLFNYVKALNAVKADKDFPNLASAFKANQFGDGSKVYSYSLEGTNYRFWIHINTSSTAQNGTYNNIIGKDNNSSASMLAPYGFIVVKESK